jgi:hypothetical protein
MSTTEFNPPLTNTPAGNHLQFLPKRVRNNSIHLCIIVSQNELQGAMATLGLSTDSRIDARLIYSHSRLNILYSEAVQHYPS